MNTHKLRQAVKANHALAYAKPTSGPFLCSTEAEESDSYANAVYAAILRDAGVIDSQIMDDMALSFQELGKLMTEIRYREADDERFKYKKRLVKNWMRLNKF